MKTSKLILSVILAVVLCVGVTSFNAVAKEKTSKISAVVKTVDSKGKKITLSYKDKATKKEVVKVFSLSKDEEAPAVRAGQKVRVTLTNDGKGVKKIKIQAKKVSGKVVAFDSKTKKITLSSKDKATKEKVEKTYRISEGVDVSALKAGQKVRTTLSIDEASIDKLKITPKKVSASVIAIDNKAKKITLLHKDRESKKKVGKVYIISKGLDVTGVKVGQKVKAALSVDESAVEKIKVVAKKITAKVIAIDSKAKKITLSYKDQSTKKKVEKVFLIAKGVDVTAVKVGGKVRATLSIDEKSIDKIKAKKAKAPKKK